MKIFPHIHMSSLVRPFTQLFGVVFTLFGIAGFFVYGDLLWFDLDLMQNIAHLLTGVIGLYAAMSSRERMYLLVFGLLYVVIAIAGYTQGGDVFGLFDVGIEEAYTYGIIAVICIVLGTSRRN